MHRYARIVEETLELLRVEQYGVVATSGLGGLVVSGFRGGARYLYHYRDGSLVRLVREPVSGAASMREGVERVVFYRDVARGRELHKLYWVSVERPGEERELHPEQRPTRLLGAAYDGETVAYSAVGEAGISVYAARGGRLWKAADVPGLAMIAAVRGDLAAGAGIFPPETRLFKPFTVDLASGELRVHEPPARGNVLALDIAPDGSVYYGLETARDARIYRLDPSTGRSEEEPHRGLREMGATSFNALRFTSEGRLLVAARKWGRSRVFLGGEELRVPEGMHWGGFQHRESVALTHTSRTSPPRVILATREGYRVLLEGEKPWWLGEAQGVTRLEWVESRDGERVPVWVSESRRAPTPGPAVVLVHGGPFSEDADYWDVFATALQAAGFHVVQPNYRGSTGYGLEWTEKIIGDPCGAELEDVAAAARWALQSGLASRVYIMGYSYGGYMTLCSLTRKPGLYRAGVAGAPVADWGEMYELSDPAFKMFIEMLFAGRRDLWRERSPITHIDSMREPLMVIQATNDTRTPLRPVLRFIQEAAEKGKYVEAQIAPDMGHAVNTVEDAVKILLPALLFLARMEDRAR